MTPADLEDELNTLCGRVTAALEVCNATLTRVIELHAECFPGIAARMDALEARGPDRPIRGPQRIPGQGPLRLIVGDGCADPAPSERPALRVVPQYSDAG